MQGLDDVLALHVSQQRAQRMFGCKLVLAARHQQHNRVTVQAASKVAEQFTTARVRPLHVIQHDQQRRSGADGHQQLIHSLPQPQLLRVYVSVRLIASLAPAPRPAGTSRSLILRLVC